MVSIHSIAASAFMQWLLARCRMDLLLVSIRSVAASAFIPGCAGQFHAIDSGVSIRSVAAPVFSHAHGMFRMKMLQMASQSAHPRLLISYKNQSCRGVKWRESLIHSFAASAVIMTGSVHNFIYELRSQSALSRPLLSRSR